MLQLKLSASPKSPHNSSSTSPKTRSKEEVDDDDDDDNDIEDPETLNRTLTEIIDGKRSSTSLMALLNKEDTDSESIHSSSSSDNSGVLNIHKGRGLIRTPSLSSKTNGSDISSIPEVACENLEENSAIGQFKEVDLSAETGYELNGNGADKNDVETENQSSDVNGCRFTLGSEAKHKQETVNQSSGNGPVNQANCDSSPELNGDITNSEHSAIDSTVQTLHNSTGKLNTQTKHVSNDMSDISTTNQS